MIVGQRVVCWRVRDEQGAKQDRRLAGIAVEPGEDPPVLEVAEAVLDRGAGGGQDLVSLPLGGGGLAGCGDLAGGAAGSWGDPGQVACLAGESTKSSSPCFLCLPLLSRPWDNRCSSSGSRARAAAGGD
jgi:hypothetical protein